MEREFKHTPGEWFAKEERDGWAVIAKEEKKAFSVSRLYICREIEQGYDMGEADAKLIAASPSMLQTLERIANCNDLATAQEYARDAINKATS